MEIINNIFYIVLFTTAIGTGFTILSLLLTCVFRINIPLWFRVLGMILYVLPVPAPGLFLISPETTVWIRGYRIACRLWVCGILLFALYSLVKTLFAHWAVSSYRICDDETIIRICAGCARMAELRNVPRVYSRGQRAKQPRWRGYLATAARVEYPAALLRYKFDAPTACCGVFDYGTLDDPACVIGALHPAIILNEKVINKLTEEQLMTVLMHEVTHIKRKRW